MKRIIIVEVDERDPEKLEVGFWCADCFIECNYKLFTPPTDEEICEHREFCVPIEFEDGFFEGANWMKGLMQ